MYKVYDLRWKMGFNIKNVMKMLCTPRPQLIRETMKQQTNEIVVLLKPVYSSGSY